MQVDATFERDSDQACEKLIQCRLQRGLYLLLFTTWARFPLFSQVIKFNIPRSLIETGEGGAETIAINSTIYIFPQGNYLDQHSTPPPPQKKKKERKKDIQPSH